MKLYLKQKVFSWKADYSVKNEREEDVYHVQGEFFSLGNRLHIHDMQERELAQIHQKLMTLLSRFVIEIDGQEAAQLVKEFTFWKPRYRLEGTDWRLEGDWADHNYTLMDGDRTVMRLSKAWFTWGDSYELEIERPEDALLSLCIALAVDCVLDADAAAASSAAT